MAVANGENGERVYGGLAAPLLQSRWLALEAFSCDRGLVIEEATTTKEGGWEVPREQELDGIMGFQVDVGFLILPSKQPFVTLIECEYVHDTNKLLQEGGAWGHASTSIFDREVQECIYMDRTASACHFASVHAAVQLMIPAQQLVAWSAERLSEEWKETRALVGAIICSHEQ